MSPQSDCPCMRRTGSDSNCSSASGSSSNSAHRRLSRSAGSVRVFPATEPEDYCRPTLSVNTKLEETQRLAVLLDQNLWKPDGESVECDTLGCGTRFTLFERKHHCRKCGGIFCNTCSSKTIPLLDTSRMPFVIPPANVPLPLLTVSSPTGALVPSRVCTDCYALLTGAVPPSIERVRSASASALPTTTASPRLRAAKASTDNVPGLSNSPSGSSSQNGYAHSNTSGSAMYYPCGTTFVVKPRHLRRSRTTSSNTGRTPSPVIPRRDSLNTARSASPSVHAQSRASPFPQPPTPITPAAAADYTSLGVLAEYPLKVSSKGCKESGGAFWVPKPLPRRMDSPIRYEAPSPRRTPERHVSEIDEDVEEADEGAPPVVPIRRTIARSTFEVSIEKAPFGCPAHAREPDHVSNF